MWRLKSVMETHKENVKAREKEWREYERKITVYHEQFNNARRNLETLLREEEESRFAKTIQSRDAANKVLRRIKDFRTELHEAERRIPDTYREMEKQENQLIPFKRYRRHMDENYPGGIKYMDKELTIALSKFKSNEGLMEARIAKWENMAEGKQENLMVPYQKSIDQKVLWRPKTYLEEIETYRENVEAFDGKLEKYNREKGQYHETLDTYELNRKNLETKFDEQGVSRYTRVPITYDAARDILRRMNDFMTELHEVESRILDSYREMMEHEHQLLRLEMNMTNMDEKDPERIKNFWKDMDKDLTIALGKWERDKIVLEAMIVKWENMIEMERENLAVRCQSCLDQMLLWPLKTRMEIHNDVKVCDMKWEKYERKKRAYHEKLDNFESARRNLETMLDEQRDSRSSKVSLICTVARFVLRIMKDFTTELRKTEREILERHLEIKNHEQKLLEIRMRLINENAPDKIKDIDKDLTTALNRWERNKEALDKNIVEWEYTVNRKRENDAEWCQWCIDDVRDKAKLNTTLVAISSIGTIYGLGVAAFELLTGGIGGALGAAVAGVGAVTGTIQARGTKDLIVLLQNGSRHNFCC